MRKASIRKVTLIDGKRITIISVYQFTSYLMKGINIVHSIDHIITLQHKILLIRDRSSVNLV